MIANVTLTAYFLDNTAGNRTTITLDASPTGTGTFSWSLPGMTATIPYTVPFDVNATDDLTVITAAVAGYAFVDWEDGSTALTRNVGTHMTTATATYTAFVDRSPPPSVKDYYITAISDSGSTTSPSGVTIVQQGDSLTVRWSAHTGYAVNSVIVDGRELSQAQVDQGYYIFSRVNANHQIEVYSTPTITLEVVVVSGKGTVDFSSAGRTYETYMTTVQITRNASLKLTATPDDGYAFGKWVHGTTTYTGTELDLGNVGSSVRVEVHFLEDDGKSFLDDYGWLILAIIALAIAGAFIWWFFFVFRRAYEVIKIASSAAIIGKDKVRRKTKYVFSIEGGPSGTVSYKVGENGIEKTLTAGPQGEYIIPKKDVVDKITIEVR
jgi:hypothetical protein